MKISAIKTNIVNNKSFKNASNAAIQTTTMSFDEFIRLPQKNAVRVQIPVAQKAKITKKQILIGAGITVGVGLAILGIVKNRNNIKDMIETLKLKKTAKSYNKLFPQDAQYRNSLAREVGLNNSETYKLNSIAGTQELHTVMEKYKNDPAVFTPGMAIYNTNGSLAGFDGANTTTGKFGVNLHVHTENSDGKGTVQEILDKASEYANKRAAVKKEPFYLALTDHDSIEDCKEAIEIIKKDPKKYKNLRLFPGIENTTIYKDPNVLNGDGQFHVLAYGINPYSEGMKNFISGRINKNRTNINTAIQKANELYSTLSNGDKINFDIDDFAKMNKSIKTRPVDANYLMKDYLQFKIIFSEAISNNKKLAEFLVNKNITLPEIDYSKPIASIPKNLDYSQGQTYYGYYYETLQKYLIKALTKKNTSVNEAEIKNLFPALSDKTKSILNQIENRSSNSATFVPKPEMISFEKCVETFASEKNAVLSIAHPGIIFPQMPENVVKDTNKLPQLYEKLFNIFKTKGGETAKYVEGFYPYYNKPETLICKQLIENAKNLGFKMTGGLDSHYGDVLSTGIRC